ncbi:DNA-binding cell division cycle control protein, partial [Pseudoloma neurophilia]
NKNSANSDSANLKPEELTAIRFKALRNDLLDFLTNPTYSNPLIAQHKTKLINIQEKLHPSGTIFTSIHFLQSCATILFHNYYTDQANFIFTFLYDLNCLNKTYQTIWSTILWLKREKEQLGIVARKAVLTQGNLPDLDITSIKQLNDEENTSLKQLNDENTTSFKQLKDDTTTSFKQLNNDTTTTSFKQHSLDTATTTSFKQHSLTTTTLKQKITYNMSETWIILSNYFSLCSDHNRSVICLKKGINTDNLKDRSIFYYPYLLLAHELMIKHDYEKATKFFYKTLRMNHNSYSAMYGIGMVMLKTSQYDYSGSNQNIEILSNNEDENINISEYTTAKHFFKKSIKIVPSNKAIRFMLIRHMVKIRELKEVLKEILEYFKENTPIQNGNESSKRFLTSDFKDELNEMIMSDILKKDLNEIFILIQKSNLKDEYTDSILLEFVEVLCLFKLYKIGDKILRTTKNSNQAYKKRREMVDVGLSGNMGNIGNMIFK